MEVSIREIMIPGKALGANLWVKVIPLGDIHLGAAGCSINKLKKIIEYIRMKENCYWIGMGDYVDCINYTDKRFDPATVAKSFVNNLSNCVPSQIEALVKLLEPIKDKCLGLLRGNHEEKIRLKHQYNVIYEMRKALGFDIPDLKDSAIVRLRFVPTDLQSRKTNRSHSGVVDIFCVHGKIGGHRSGAKVNRLEDMIGYIDADIYLMGHSHIKLTASRSVLYVDQRLNVRHKKRIMAVTGSFLNSYIKGTSSYVEKGNYPPASTGCVKIMINPRRHDIHISE